MHLRRDALPHLVLRLEFACFAAFETVVGPVLTKAHVVEPHAQGAVPVAFALALGLIADRTTEFSRHGAALYAKGTGRVCDG